MQVDHHEALVELHCLAGHSIGRRLKDGVHSTLQQPRQQSQYDEADSNYAG